MESQQSKVRRPIGAMKAEAPADPAGNRRELVAVPPEAVGIVLANGLDTTYDDLVPLLDALEPDASVEGQVFLRRIISNRCQQDDS
jgi:hypothetical protein